ncbi:hypothetical protein [Chitinophaga vietnamensis]|uniref:hypothetical protein n=1 Tax=Chitinophaga vietnamensis TaxID=2593957 RepID=UPI001177B286|nr:hypothetical protein [Chitinophaga vietnamensis]
MKKVAVFIAFCALGLLAVACKGKINTQTLSASRPDIMPVYLITVGHILENEPSPATPACTPGKVSTRTAQVKDALISIFQFTQHR